MKFSSNEFIRGTAERFVESPQRPKTKAEPRAESMIEERWELTGNRPDLFQMAINMGNV